MAMEYALLHQHRPTLRKLHEAQFKPAIQALKNPSQALKMLYKNRFMVYDVKSPKGILNNIDKYGVDHRTIFNLTPLMTAAVIGNVEAVEAIISRGANRELIANNGLNAWQMALGQALSNRMLTQRTWTGYLSSPLRITDKKYVERLANMYSLLAPDAIIVQANGRLEKLDEHSMHGFLVNVFFALWYTDIADNVLSGHGLTAAGLTEILSFLPDKMLSSMKKKRQYISRYLSENEVERESSHNRKLFKRIKRGHYVLNPQLKIKLTDKWLDLHQLLALNDWEAGILDFVLAGDKIAFSGEAKRYRDEFHEENYQNFLNFCEKESALQFDTKNEK